MPRSSVRRFAAALVIGFGMIAGAHGQTAPTAAPRTLGPGDCAALAAAGSTAANLLDWRRLADAPGPSGRRGDRSDASRAIRAELEGLAALEARNRSAGAALELYHRLAGVEARLGLLRRGIVEVDAAIAEVERIRARGLAAKVDEAALRRRRRELEGEDLELALARSNLRGSLQTLGKFGPEPWTLAPPPIAEALELSPAADPAAAVARGLARRPESRLLRLALRTLDSGTAPVARLLLASSDPIAGGTPRGRLGLRAIRAHSAPDPDLCVLRRQLELYTADRERAVAEEIAQAVRTVRVRFAEVDLARKQVQSWDDEVARVEERTRQGLASFAEALPARAGLLKATEALIAREVDRDVALAKLRQAQGVLPCDRAGQGAG